MSVSVKEEIVVTGEAPVVDTTKTVIGGTVSTETLQKLPLGRNFTAIAQTFAGTTTAVWTNNVVVYGATGLENQYIVDGVNTTGIKIGDQGKTRRPGVHPGDRGQDRRLRGRVLTRPRRHVQRRHEVGRQRVPRRRASATTTPRASRAATAGRPTARPSARARSVLPKRLDGGADLGGYFLKDRIWFFGAYDGVKTDQDINERVGYSWATKTTTTTASSTTDIANNYSGKLTFRLGESNTIAVSVFGDPETYTGRLSDIIAPAATQDGKITLRRTGRLRQVGRDLRHGVPRPAPVRAPRAEDRHPAEQHGPLGPDGAVGLPDVLQRRLGLPVLDERAVQARRRDAHRDRLLRRPRGQARRQLRGPQLDLRGAVRRRRPRPGPLLGRLGRLRLLLQPLLLPDPPELHRALRRRGQRGQGQLRAARPGERARPGRPDLPRLHALQLPHEPAEDEQHRRLPPGLLEGRAEPDGQRRRPVRRPEAEGRGRQHADPRQETSGRRASASCGTS